MQRTPYSAHADTTRHEYCVQPAQCHLLSPANARPTRRSSVSVAALRHATHQLAGRASSRPGLLRAVSAAARRRRLCGDPFPPYAYSLPWFEFDAGPGKLPLRVVGDLKAERDQKMRPLLVLPSPGLSYEYLENLEALTISQRRVAFADLRSAGAPDALVARILDAVAALESPGGVHLLGYGYGAALALRVYSSSVVSGGAVRGYDWNSPCNPM